MMINSKTTVADFEIHAKIGEGAFSQVYKVKRIEDNKFYAMKKVQITTMSEKDRKNAVNQVRLLASQKSSFVISYKQAFCDQKAHNLYLIMQYAQGGDISSKIKSIKQNGKYFEEAQIWKALIHISLGLLSLHSKKIIHRDLKSANVFITADGNYKLGDLNVSKVLKNEVAKTQIGTPLYIPPQIWKNKPYDYKSDIWSLGCIIYQMATQRTPFIATDIQGLYRKITSAELDRIPKQYSQKLWNLIKSMLQKNPQLRPTAFEILNRPQAKQNYKDLCDVKNSKQQYNFLIATLKFNLYDMKQLKNILPQAQYETSSLKQIVPLNNSQKQMKFRINRKSLKQIMFRQRKPLIDQTPKEIKRYGSAQCQNKKPIRLFNDNLENKDHLLNNGVRIQSIPKNKIKRIVRFPMRHHYDLLKKDKSKNKFVLRPVVSCKNIRFSNQNIQYKQEQQKISNIFQKNKI